MYEVHVDTRGPVFNGVAKHAASQYTREVVWEITKGGRGDLGVRFIKVFKNPTGAYESTVNAERPVPITGGWTGRLDGEGKIYAWWLEGIGSRNYPVTRFRGYASFRTVAQELQLKAVPIAQRHLPVFIARMNGGPA